MHILACENDPLEREWLKFLLERDGFGTTIHDNPHQLLRHLQQGPDAIILFTPTADMPPLRFCQALRQSCDAPLVILSDHVAKQTLSDLYDAGADEVWQRPITGKLLLARIRNLKRRATKPILTNHSENRIQVGTCTLYPELLELKVGTNTHRLTPTQTRLLHHLMRHAGQTIPHARLEHHLWGHIGGHDSQGLKGHIYHLRRKLERNPREPGILTTAKGIGYRFETGPTSAVKAR